MGSTERFFKKKIASAAELRLNNRPVQSGEFIPLGQGDIISNMIITAYNISFDCVERSQVNHLNNLGDTELRFKSSKKR